MADAHHIAFKSYPDWEKIVPPHAVDKDLYWDHITILDIEAILGHVSRGNIQVWIGGGRKGITIGELYYHNITFFS